MAFRRILNKGGKEMTKTITFSFKALKITLYEVLQGYFKCFEFSSRSYYSCGQNPPFDF